ncbi:MAG: M48 family metalloprotease [Planctomycetota bacterium]
MPFPFPRQQRRYRRTSRRRNTIGSGFKVRLVIAAAIALFSLFSYLSTSTLNPVTGEKQRVAITTEEEIAIGLQAVSEMARQHGGDHPDAEAQAMVDGMGEYLVQSLDRWLAEQNRENPYRFEFHLLRDDRTVNAFALPGGQVFITYALFSRLQTEGQLAGVLGHEIGHVIERHSARRMAAQKLTSGLAGAAGMAGGSWESARMAQAVGQMVNMRYGRQDELESDKWGVLLTSLAGYDPRSMIGVMNVLEEASGGNSSPEIFSTHPKPANRRQYIESVIVEVFPNGLPGGLKP